MLKKKKRGLASRRSRGQSTLEYLVLVTAVVAAFIVFLPGSFRIAYNSVLNKTTNAMINMADRLSGSRPLAP